jgi:hypothetical protein
VEGANDKMNTSVADGQITDSCDCCEVVHEAAIVYFGTDQGTVKLEHYHLVSTPRPAR